MTENNLPLIDSNILIYSVDSSDVKKHTKAKFLLKNCWSGKTKFAVSIQNLSEFFVNATKKIENPLSKEIGESIVKNIIKFDGFVKIKPNESTILKAMKISKGEEMNYWDALIEATMIENNIFCIYTENVKDFKSKRIKVVNPLI